MKSGVDYQATTMLVIPPGTLAEQTQKLACDIQQSASRLNYTIQELSKSKNNEALRAISQEYCCNILQSLTQLSDCLGWHLIDLMNINLEQIRKSDPMRYAAVNANLYGVKKVL